MKLTHWKPHQTVSIFSGVASIMTNSLNLKGTTTDKPPEKGQTGIYQIEVALLSGKMGYFPPNRVILADRV